MPSCILPTSAGAVLATSAGTAFTAGLGAGVAGAYAQLTAATDADAYGVICYPQRNSQGWFDLAVGAASAEQVIAQIPSASGSSTISFFTPVFIPAGSRLSVRGITSNYGDNCLFSVILVRGNSKTELVSYGRIIGFTNGVPSNCDTGATAHTKGAYTQIIASTTRDARGYSLSIRNSASNTASMNALIDLAVGAAASEKIILADVYYESAAYYYPPIVIGPIWTPIPAGSRLAIRGQCNNTVLAERQPTVSMVLWE